MAAWARILLMIVGGGWAVGHLLLAIIAVTDSLSRCPGNQCSDAVGSGGYYGVSALIGVLLVVASVAARGTRSAGSQVAGS